MRPVLAAGAIAGMLVLTACGSGPAVVTGEPGATPYDGPMSLPLDHSDEATVTERSGAAGRALECEDEPYNGGGGEYEDGLASTQDSATEALENLFAEDFFWSVPQDGYRVERRDDGRALLSYDVDGRTKVAFIAADDVRDWKHRTGWGIEAWAQCDPAELPAAVSDALDIGVWTDASGGRVPVTTIQSYLGPEHCDWQDITFLEFGLTEQAGADNREEYLRDTEGELVHYLRTTFSADAVVPKDATDSGYRRDGRELWLVPSKEAAYLVSVDDPKDVERWPGTTQGIGCD
jgi:hypothetical protein